MKGKEISDEERLNFIQQCDKVYSSSEGWVFEYLSFEPNKDVLADVRIGVRAENNIRKAADAAIKIRAGKG